LNGCRTEFVCRVVVNNSSPCSPVVHCYVNMNMSTTGPQSDDVRRMDGLEQSLMFFLRLDQLIIVIQDSR
jgi:hypothetical protein